LASGRFVTEKIEISRPTWFNYDKIIQPIGGAGILYPIAFIRVLSGKNTAAISGGKVFLRQKCAYAATLSARGCTEHGHATCHTVPD